MNANDMRRVIIKFLPILLFPTIVICLKSILPPWGFMWLLAGSIFFGCKWLTLAEGFRSDLRPNLRLVAGYLFTWPGMDANSFLNKSPGFRPRFGEWVAAIAKLSVGVLLFWGVANHIPNRYPMIQGWIGMVGIIFILHFGVFHVIALYWQTAGVQAVHLFKSPVFSTSLAELWGRKWNLGFHELSHRFVFTPLSRRIGLSSALLSTFIASGLVHDLVISFPADGGYFQPTAYFLIQGIGVLFEKSRVGKRFGLSKGVTGWIFMAICTLTPIRLLFHEPFVLKVILPFMKFLRAF